MAKEIPEEDVLPSAESESVLRGEDDFSEVLVYGPQPAPMPHPNWHMAVKMGGDGPDTLCRDVHPVVRQARVEGWLIDPKFPHHLRAAFEVAILDILMEQGHRRLKPARENMGLFLKEEWHSPVPTFSPFRPDLPKEHAERIERALLDSQKLREVLKVARAARIEALKALIG